MSGLALITNSRNTNIVDNCIFWARIMELPVPQLLFKALKFDGLIKKILRTDIVLPLHRLDFLLDVSNKTKKRIILILRIRGNEWCAACTRCPYV